MNYFSILFPISRIFAIGVAIYGIYYNQIMIRSKWDHESGQTKKFDIN